MACNAHHIFVLFALLASAGQWKLSEALGTFGFDIHHVLSDQVKEIMAGEGPFPEKDSLEYYRLLIHRDRWIRGRGLASNNIESTLTFTEGNMTARLGLGLQFLHYANVTVGTPARWFLVALDTASDLFWLPCKCRTCASSLPIGQGRMIDLNMYSPNASSTSSGIGCDSSKCLQSDQCSSSSSDCPYQVEYNPNSTSSGILVEDVLHLITEDEDSKLVEAQIRLGCGQVQTGDFARDLAMNGLLGLGQGNLSVPNELANQGIASNSFSMCFGGDRTGRISFGDKGSSDQAETPFNPGYNVNVTHINVGGRDAALEFTATFDSGVSFSSLTDPTYTLLTESFNNLALDPRRAPDSIVPFEFCYSPSPNKTVIQYPIVDLTMNGEAIYKIQQAIVIVRTEESAFYCLAVIRNNDANIIGQNFMTGHRLVFDRERMVLGWRESDCYDASASNSTSSLTPPPPPPLTRPSPRPQLSPTPSPSTENAPSPVNIFNPNTTALPPSSSVTLKPLTYTLLLVVVLLLAFL